MGVSTLRCLLNLFVPVMFVGAGVAALAQTPTYNLGKTPTDQEIRAMGIIVGPEGKELPPGSGTAKDGAEIYARKCVACHGPTGAEHPAAPRSLLGDKATLTTMQAVKTIGSYWPFATTIWDYINRAMPPKQEGSLTADEVYAVTAFVLYQNGIIQESDVIDAKSLPKVPMPNRDGFVPSPWPEWKVPKAPSENN